MAKKSQYESFKTVKARIWVVGNTEFTSKNVAYRYCRTRNGTKTGGKKIYTVERKNA